MGAAALDALGTMLAPARLGFLAFGVFVGLALGVIPGLGGLIGLSLLLPFTYSLDPFAALAVLIGVTAVTTTSDTIPAVLFGVPGTVGSAATVLDGHPLAQKGEASRALGAAFFASLLGGLIGAALLGLSIPMLRPFMLAIATPELLAFCIFGLSLVAALSGGNAFKGVAAACLGLLLAAVGEDSQAGELRWTFGSVYLWDGLALVPLALGLFALPELAELYARRTGIAEGARAQARAQEVTQLDGVRDVLRRPFLMSRCAAIGALLGAVPGVGSAVIDWVAYGHAARTEKGAAETFGKGDIRGVIASESSNNAKEGGALVPTIAFGVPGSASMALLLGAFTAQGVVPGPRMLSDHLDVTYALVWSVALANILGAGACFLAAKQFAKLALVRSSVLAPLVVAVAFVGAFQATRAWEDLYLFLGAGVVGYVMKRLGWPRPPVILGFVLGGLVERYAFISVFRYGAVEWMLRPAAGALVLLSLWGVLGPMLRALRRGRRAGGGVGFGWPGAGRPLDAAFGAGMTALFAAAWASAEGWSRFAALAPQAVALVGAVAAAGATLGLLLLRPAGPPEAATPRAETLRAAGFYGWILGALAAAAVIGVLPALALAVLLWLRFGGGEGWALSAALAAATLVAFYGLFHVVLTIPWPDAALGDLFPALRAERAFRLF